MYSRFHNDFWAGENVVEHDMVASQGEDQIIDRRVLEGWKKVYLLSIRVSFDL
jgi:hypothetical protein